MSKFLCLRYPVKNHSGFWRAFFSRRRFLRIAASIPGVIQGLPFPQLEMFLVWMGKCSLKTESKVIIIFMEIMYLQGCFGVFAACNQAVVYVK